MTNNRVSNYIYEKRGQIISFLVTFVLCMRVLLPQEDMLQGYGDVADIWKTISSFYSSNVEPSYVLYKGFLSVYPYVWLVKISQMLGMGDWFLLKIFHSVLFSCVVSIGVPFVVSKLFHIQIKPWRRILLCVLGFYLWNGTKVIQTIMIDLPSLFLFVFSVCAAIKIAEQYKTINKLYFLYAGLLFGCACQYTGQYAPSITLLLIFVLVAMFYKKVKEYKGKLVPVLVSVLLLFVGFTIPKAYNHHFENTFVQQFRDDGVWIGDSEFWTDLAISQAKRRYTMFWGPTIMNQRTLAMIMEDKGEEYECFVESLNYSIGYSKKDVLKLVIKHPVDFVTSWCNGFLLTVSMNGNDYLVYNRVSFLLISYTTLFMTLYILFRQWKTLKGVFVKETYIIIAFVLPALVTCVTHFEPRYVIAMQSLILGTAIYHDTFWNIFKDSFALLKQCVVQRSIQPLVQIFNTAKFPYTFVLYCVFVVMCFSNYAAIYETFGADNSILFQW